MAPPPPPGTHSLPARPPPSASSGGGFTKGGFKASFSSAPTSYSATPTYGASAPKQSYTPPVQNYGPSAPPTTSQYGGGSYAGTGANAAQSSSYSYSQPSAAPGYDGGYTAAPQIKNPFPIGGGSAAPTSDFDPEYAAQLAQWQSAYNSTETTTSATGAAPAKPDYAAYAAAQGDKKKTVQREGGGKKWTDDSLLEWDPSHLRLFVGNLAGETTDDSLLKAFSRWASVQKARVIRDKRSTKSKGYGFVSFSNADDFFAAAKEMNGKYIQSHPVVVKKANTEIKATNAKDKDRGRNGKNNRNKNKNKSGNGGGAGGQEQQYEANLGPYAGAGVVKPGQKTKNGLKLLG